MRSNEAPTTLAAWLAAAILAGCNTFTGVDELEVDRDRSDEEQEPAPAFTPADGITIEGVELYQGFRRGLMKDGAPVSTGVPIVRGRDAVMRIFYQATDPVQLTARVTIGEQEPIEIDALADATSAAEIYDSTINVPIAGEALTEPSFRVELLQPTEETSGENGAAVYPAADEEPALLSLSDSGPLRLVVVPFRYDADGSGRLPDTSEEQMTRLRDRFESLYPVPEVDVRVAEPLPTSTPVSGIDFDGWSLLLDELASHRDQSGAAPEEYYLGLFNAADSFGEFCSQGCITGLSLVAKSPSDAYSRASIAIGYTGEASVETATHEVGHAHGRRHAPGCDAGNIDPSFPPDNVLTIEGESVGTIGDLGLDLDAGQLVVPDTADFMSYCDPAWTGGYTFEGLFERSQQVNLATADVVPGPRRRYERIVIVGDRAVWRGRSDLRPTHGGERVAVEALGREPARVEGRLHRFDHVGGGILLVPATGAEALRIALEHRTLTVSR